MDDDASFGEEEGSTLVRHEADSRFENRGKGQGSTTETARPIQTATVHSVRSGLIGSTLSGSSGRHPSKPPLIALSIDTASKEQRVKRTSPTHLDIQSAKLHEPVTGSVYCTNVAAQQQPSPMSQLSSPATALNNVAAQQ